MERTFIVPSTIFKSFRFSLALVDACPTNSKEHCQTIRQRTKWKASQKKWFELECPRYKLHPTFLSYLLFLVLLIVILLVLFNLMFLCALQALFGANDLAECLVLLVLGATSTQCFVKLSFLIAVLMTVEWLSFQPVNNGHHNSHKTSFNTAVSADVKWWQQRLLQKQSTNELSRQFAVRKLWNRLNKIAATKLLCLILKFVYLKFTAETNWCRRHFSAGQNSKCQNTWNTLTQKVVSQKRRRNGEVHSEGTASKSVPAEPHCRTPQTPPQNPPAETNGRNAICHTFQY